MIRRLFLSAALLLASAGIAAAQCVGVGGVNTVPQTGVVCSQESSVATFAATGIGLVPGTAPTDIACLTGSATQTIRLKSVELSGTAGTAINIVATLRKHASANTGGTAATSTALPVPYRLDSASAAPTATTQAWTANPTIADSSPGIIGAKTLFLPVTSTAVSPQAVAWNFWPGQAVAPPVLRGIAQQVCVNLGGVTAPSSGLMTVSFAWTEASQ